MGAFSENGNWWGGGGGRRLKAGCVVESQGRHLGFKGGNATPRPCLNATLYYVCALCGCLPVKLPIMSSLGIVGRVLNA